MIFKRKDAVLVKDIPPLNRIMPYIMFNRCDACNITLETLDCEPLDAYIKEKKQEGIEYTYMDLIMAGMIRTIHYLPKLKYYVVNGRIYSRKKIACAIALHRSLRGENAETTVKVEFNGDETIEEIKKIFTENVERELKNTSQNDTDTLCKVLTAIPAFLIKGVVNLLMWMDRHNIMPNIVAKLSPFHTTFWITNLKSLGIGTIYHHITNFGTASEFIAMGKEKYVATVVDRDRVVIKKKMELGLVLDERICDGLYYARATKMLHKILANPAVLEKKPEEKK